MVQEDRYGSQCRSCAAADQTILRSDITLPNNLYYTTSMLIDVPVQALGYVTNLKRLVIPLIVFNCSELDRLKCNARRLALQASNGYSVEIHKDLKTKQSNHQQSQTENFPNKAFRCEPQQKRTNNLNRSMSWHSLRQDSTLQYSIFPADTCD